MIKRPTACVTSAGADGGTPSDEKKAEAEKTPKNAQSPQRRVHAVLGGGSRSQARLLSHTFKKHLRCRSTRSSWDDIILRTETTVKRLIAPQLLLLAGKTRTGCATSTRRAGALHCDSDCTSCGAWSAFANWSKTPCPASGLCALDPAAQRLALLAGGRDEITLFYRQQLEAAQSA